ncbi:MAG: glycosyltransferase [Patescibacteria group bacterium]
MNHTKRKILYIITKSRWAGAGKYTHDLATNLPPEQFEVVVAAGGEGQMAKKIKEKNIQYYNIGNFQRDISIFKDILAFFEILSLIFKTKPKIIHVSSSKAGGLTGLAIFIYKIFKKCTAVFTAHGWAFAEQRPKTQIKLIKFTSKLTCLFYNNIICVSEFDRQLAIKNQIAPEKKLVTIHNGVKPEDYNFLSKEQAREELTKNKKTREQENQLWVGTIGEDTKNKGHKYLKNAFPEAVIFKNLIPADKYLKAFDIFVLPSIKEGLPYILMEAGLAHLPVIASAVGGVPEIINEDPSTGSGQATGLLVKPADEKELAEKIETLTNNPKLRSDLSYALWEKINREFTFPKMLEATINVYKTT